MLINKSDKIYLAGHQGMVGTAVLRKLITADYTSILTQSRQETNLLDQTAVTHYFAKHKPDYVIIAAAKVGGIKVNLEHPVEFLYENLTIQNNIITAAASTHVKKIIFLASSCIYPRQCRQPIHESFMLDSRPEPSNEGYALAKILGIKLLEYYKQQYGLKSVTLVPCNLYGTNDQYHTSQSQVMAALIKKFCDAVINKQTQVDLWGSGIARREFMHVDDIADAIIYFLDKDVIQGHINIGWGQDISISDLSQLIANATGFKGQVYWDPSKLDGILRKRLDITNMKSTGFRPKITLRNGITNTIQEYYSLKNNL